MDLVWKTIAWLHRQQRVDDFQASVKDAPGSLRLEVFLRTDHGAWHAGGMTSPSSPMSTWGSGRKPEGVAAWEKIMHGFLSPCCLHTDPIRTRGWKKINNWANKTNKHRQPCSLVLPKDLIIGKVIILKCHWQYQLFLNTFPCYSLPNSFQVNSWWN